MDIIARIRTEFPEKFGIPRQSGLVGGLEGLVVFEPAFRAAEALRGIEGFSHLWLIWGFSGVPQGQWSPTVRPPRLGGDARMGVFATRSPFRPNRLGLSSVRLLGVEERDGLGHCLRVGGADLMDGTPIYDIKPYLPYTDSHPDAVGGFADAGPAARLRVNFPANLLEQVPPERRAALLEVLAQDPRPAYQDDPGRRYGLSFAGRDIRFYVEGDTLRVAEVVLLERPCKENGNLL